MALSVSAGCMGYHVKKTDSFVMLATFLFIFFTFDVDHTIVNFHTIKEIFASV